MPNYYLLENGTDRFLLEDGTSLLLNEDSPSFFERDATATGDATLSVARAAITVRDAAVAPSVTVSSAGAGIYVRDYAPTASASVASADATVLARSGTASADATVSGDGENADTGPDYQERDATATGEATVSVSSAGLWHREATATATAAASGAALIIWAVDAATTGAATTDGQSAAIIEVSTVVECGAAVDGQAEGEEPPATSSGGVAWAKAKSRGWMPVKPRNRSEVVGSSFAVECVSIAQGESHSVRIIRPTVVPEVVTPVPVYEVPAPSVGAEPEPKKQRKPASPVAVHRVTVPRRDKTKNRLGAQRTLLRRMEEERIMMALASLLN